MSIVHRRSRRRSVRSARQVDAGFARRAVRVSRPLRPHALLPRRRTWSAARSRRPVATPARVRRGRLLRACRTRRRCRGGCAACRSTASARRCRAAPRAAALRAATPPRCRRRSAADGRLRARVRSRRRPRCRRARRDSVGRIPRDASSIALRVSFVNLQKFTLWACVAPASIRMLAPAQKMPGLAGPQRHHAHVGMLEAQTLDRIGEFDVDAEVVGILLELVAGRDASRLRDVEDQFGEWRLDFQLPVPISGRLGAEIQRCRCGWVHRLVAARARRRW